MSIFIDLKFCLNDRRNYSYLVEHKELYIHLITLKINLFVLSYLFSFSIELIQINLKNM